MCALAVTLMVLGSAAELVGLILVVLDIQTTVRQAKQVAPKPFEQAMPIKVKQGRRPMPQATGSSLPDRVGHLEALTRELEDLIYQRTNDLNERIAQVATNVADQEWNVHAREQVIREFLRDVLTADLQRRRFGVILLILGILTALAGNLIAISAC